MNRNAKEKPARIEIRTEPKNKRRIQTLAGRCNLPLSEYMVKRALGYEPKAVLPDAFFPVYDKLCQLADSVQDPKAEKALLDLLDEIRTSFLQPGKEDLSKPPEVLPWDEDKI